MHVSSDPIPHPISTSLLKLQLSHLIDNIFKLDFHSEKLALAGQIVTQLRQTHAQVIHNKGELPDSSDTQALAKS